MGKTTKTHATGTPGASSKDRTVQANKPKNTPHKGGQTAAKSRQKQTGSPKITGAAADTISQDVADRMIIDAEIDVLASESAVLATSAAAAAAAAAAATSAAAVTVAPAASASASASAAVDDDDDDGDAQSAATVKRRHTSPVYPPRAYQSRYDWKLKVQPSTKPVEALREALVTMFDQIKNEDKQNLVIYPWKTDSAINAKTKRIMKSSDIPKGVDDLQKFFDRAYPRTKGGDIYVSVYLGHKKSFHIIHGELNWWLREMNFGFYLKALQVERTIGIGWLLFSTLTMDVDALAPAILAATSVDVGLRWGVINTGRNADIPADQRVRALHIEVDAKYHSLDRAQLLHLYSSSRTKDFPLDIRMRLVPEFGELVNKDAQTKVERLRNRQAAFTHHVAKVETWEIASLDFHDSVLDGKSLRDFIMEIHSKEHPHLSLFHSVDKKWRGSSHVFTVLPQLEVEARAMIAGLMTYLKFTAGSSEKHDHILKFFTVGAGDTCPRCPKVEDAPHVWTCQAPAATHLWQASINGLQTWFREQKTAPGVATAICWQLRTWHSANPPEPQMSDYPGLREVLELQDLLGWQPLLEGRPACGWAELQHCYLLWLGRRRSGRRWLTALIKKLWEITWAQWDHRNSILGWLFLLF
jgi:hypothetical protein